MSKTSIGLDKVQSAELANKLNELLATYQVFYTNVRGYHWNIKGVNFFELHAKFEEIYTDLITKVDEVAERILTLGYVPNNAYSQYLEVSRIKEDIAVSNSVINNRSLDALKEQKYDMAESISASLAATQHKL